MKLNSHSVEFFYIAHARRRHFGVRFNFYTVKGLENQVAKFLKENKKLKLTHRHPLATLTEECYCKIPYKKGATNETNRL